MFHSISPDNPMHPEFQKAQQEALSQVKPKHLIINYIDLANLYNRLPIGGFLTFPRSKNTLNVVERNIGIRGLVSGVDYTIASVEVEDKPHANIQRLNEREMSVQPPPPRTRSANKTDDDTAEEDAESGDGSEGVSDE